MFFFLEIKMYFKDDDDDLLQKIKYDCLLESILLSQTCSFSEEYFDRSVVSWFQ